MSPILIGNCRKGKTGIVLSELSISQHVLDNIPKTISMLDHCGYEVTEI